MEVPTSQTYFHRRQSRRALTHGEEQKAVKTAAFDLQLNPGKSGSAVFTGSIRPRTRISGRCGWAAIFV